MKACPLCSSTYDDRVDFCFRDGAPLVAASRQVQAAAMAERGVARFSEGLDVPEPRSLDITDAPEPTSLRAPIVPAQPPPPPPAPEPLTGEETLPPAQHHGIPRTPPPDPEQLAVDAAPPAPAPEPEPVLDDAPDEPPEPDQEETLPPVTVPPVDIPPDLTEPDTTDFFADETTDAAVDDEDDDLYGGIPYAETPKKKDKLPVILAAASVLLVGGALFAFGGDGGDDPEPEPAPTEQAERKPPPTPPVRAEPKAPIEQPPTATAPTPTAAASAATDEPEPASAEAQDGGNGIGSVDRAEERERKRQERREQREAEREAEAQRAADQDQVDRHSRDETQRQEAERQEAERRDAARKEAERKEAERREAERRAAQQQESEPVAVAEPSGASNPWGQADEPTEGTLKISTTPRGAQVWVDDAPKGTAPVSVKLGFGSHKVRVAKDGYKDKTMVIDLQSTTRDLSFNLPQDVRSGPVIIYGSLGAKVYLGDKLLGPIPVSTTLQEGTYTFTVVQEGTFYKVTKTISFANVQGTLPITLTAQ